MKIPFDIKYRPQIESGEYKVVDNDSHNIRIICWDKKSEKKYGYCIVGLVEFGPNHEESTYYTIDGKARLKDKHPCLFIITPEPELSEFEKCLGFAMGFSLNDMEDNHNEAIKHIKDTAKELLTLAREELVGEMLTSVPKESALYKAGVLDGKAEALKEIEQDPESSYAFKRGVEYGKEEILKDLPRDGVLLHRKRACH